MDLNRLAGLPKATAEALAYFKECAYQKGYAAGRKRLEKDLSREQLAERRNAFWLRVFEASMSEFLRRDDWLMDGKPVTDLQGRIELAARAADNTLRTAVGRLKV